MKRFTLVDADGDAIRIGPCCGTVHVEVKWSDDSWFTCPLVIVTRKQAFAIAWAIVRAALSRSRL